MRPELLAPAGSLRKLETAYRFGADAAYFGVGSFSLRTKADDTDEIDPDTLTEAKGSRRLYGALNIYFHDEELDRLESEIASVAALPLDALIVSDPGAVAVIRRLLPDIELHLSTQANSVNSESVRFYRDLGFRRIILGRELTIDQIARIRNSVRDVELECFVHGAMCIAYSGRCYLSRYMAGRSGNSGDCAHSCRWEYRLVEEAKRPGEYYPVYADEQFTSILSSKDLCMFDEVPRLVDAGIDSFKIEGRMKSEYYTAVTTAAYRGAIDHATGNSSVDLQQIRSDLFNVSHREYSTGFYFGDADSVAPTSGDYIRARTFLGVIGDEVAPGVYMLEVKNQIRAGETIEYLGPQGVWSDDSNFELLDGDRNVVTKADHGRPLFIRPGCQVAQGFLIRTPLTVADGAPATDQAGSSDSTRPRGQRSRTARS